MTRRRSYNCSWVLATVVACVGAGVTADAQFGKGFLKQKIEVTLLRQRPPKVALMGTSFSVRITAQTDDAAHLTGRLAASLQSEMTSNDTRLRPTASDAETIIVCAIGAFETTSDWATRTITVNKKVGEQQVWNDKKKQNETKPVYRDVEEQQQVQTVTGSMSVAYQTVDHLGQVLDSDTLNAQYRNEFIGGQNAPTTQAVEQIVLRQVVDQVVPRLVKTIEPVRVMLGRPNDPVDDLNKLGQAGQWQMMLEKLEAMKPLQDSKKEPYRLFNIGVANEALAYETPDYLTALGLLERAQTLYAKAFEMKPDEKYFLNPQSRIAAGISAYHQLERQRAAYAERLAAAQRAAAEPKPEATTGKVEPEKEESGPRPLTNQDVIELAKAGADDSILLPTIKEAEKVDFDLSAPALKALLEAGVSKVVITAMRAKIAPPKKAAPAKRPPVKKPGGR